MKPRIRRLSKSLRLLPVGVALVVLLTSACSSNPELVLSKLDPKTSVTISYNQSPLVFVRSLAADTARDQEHVYLGPVEVNRSGDYRYYIWLASWSMTDAAATNRRYDRLESIDIIADGSPVTLKLTGASTRAIGASEPVYRKPVGWAIEAYYDVTLEQLRTIAQATDLRVQYSSTLETFELWDDPIASKAGLVEFVVHSDF
ncbi:MAG: hypothetical protein KJO01_09185 [Gammaproteobacteria bacterium]|nr:hypothetical protein [Gammaproteobacteria bacterium]